MNPSREVIDDGAPVVSGDRTAAMHVVMQMTDQPVLTHHSAPASPVIDVEVRRAEHANPFGCPPLREFP